MRIVNKDVIEKPNEQEVLFLCAVQKVRHIMILRFDDDDDDDDDLPIHKMYIQSRSLKYNIGGLVGATGERSRFLCIATEIGCRPAGLNNKVVGEEGEEEVEGKAAATTSSGAAVAAGRASSETFIVMYYFTVGQGPDYQVNIKVGR